MTLTVVDMHTGGEPLRIVTGGYPDIPNGTILEKRAYVRDHLDHLRKILMFEPRGHYDMYGALLVEPDLPGADLAVPLLNLVTPLFAAAMMVHLHKAISAREAG